MNLTFYILLTSAFTYIYIYTQKELPLLPSQTNKLPRTFFQIMGGCASKPKDLDMCQQPAPVQSETPEKKVEEQTIPQESINEAAEAKTEDEKPLVDLSEPKNAEEAPKAEEATPESTESKTKTEDDEKPLVDLSVEAPKAEEATPESTEEVKTEVATEAVAEISSAAPKA